MNNEFFGREGNRLYVNSADSQSVNYLEDHIENVSAKGAVDIRIVHAMVSEQGIVEIDDLIVGRVAIRMRIEELGRCVRNNHQPYSKRQASNLKNKADFIQKLSVNSEFELEWTLASSLDPFVETQAEEGRETHRRTKKK